MYRRITRDPLELVRHARSECHAWFDLNSKLLFDANTQDQTLDTQALCLRKKICLLDESWTSDSQYKWIWLGVAWWSMEGATVWCAKQRKTHVIFAYIIRCTYLDYGEHASIYYMPTFWNVLQIYRLNDSRSDCLAKFLNWISRDNISTKKIPMF